MRSIIRNCRFALQTSPQLTFVEDATIIIEKNSIQWLKSGEKVTKKPKDEIINGKNLVFLPGLTNGHTHVAMGYFKGLQYASRARGESIIGQLMFETEKHLTKEIVYALALHGLVECLRGGATQVVDHYYYADSVAKACVDLGMRGALCDCALDLQGPKTTADDFKRHFTFLENWKKKSPLITPVVGPHAVDSLSDEKIKELVDYSEKHQLPIHFHLAQTLDEVDKMYQRAKKTPTQFAHSKGLLGPRSLAAHAIYVNSADLQLFRETETSIAFCPSSQVVFASLAPIKQFQDHDLNIVLGTDCAGSADHMSLLRESVTAIMFQKYFYPAQPLNPLLGIEWSMNASNWLQTTPSSDFVLCDLTGHEDLLFPLHDADTILPLQLDQLPVTYAMINGKWVLKDGILKTGNLKEIRKEAHKAMNWLARKSGRMPVTTFWE